MECGSQELFCQVIRSITENTAGQRAAYLDLGRWLLANIGGVFGFVGLVFGLWKWWHYRDKILHQRFESYLRASERHLQDASLDVIERIQRPSPGRATFEPLFIDDDLCAVLREYNWDLGPNLLSVRSSADWLLERAIKRIQLRLKTESGVVAALNAQLASAYAIRGAIVVSTDDASEESGRLALGYLQTAAKLAGKDAELDLKELEAHQLRKLGSRNAKHGYKELMELAAQQTDARLRDYRMARAKRYVAELEQATSVRNAYKIMTTEAPGSEYYPGALMLLYRCDPLTDWERVEIGDMHYFTAHCANLLNYKTVVKDQLDEAATAYQGVGLRVTFWSWLLRRDTRRLHQQATNGSDRVARARNGTFESDWLPDQRNPKNRKTTPPA